MLEAVWVHNSWLQEALQARFFSPGAVKNLCGLLSIKKKGNEENASKRNIAHLIKRKLKEDVVDAISQGTKWNFDYLHGTGQLTLTYYDNPHYTYKIITSY